MQNEKISIIVPAYNIQNYVEKAVKSICDQTYRNLEIILVDDGSRDGTGEILDCLAAADSRIKVIHKENGGVTSARFCGIEAASGQWIGFVDGDDYIEPEMYQVLMDNARKHQADISHCGYQMVFPSRVDLYYGTGQLVVQEKREALASLLEGSLIEPGLWNKLFRRELLQRLIEEAVMDFSVKNNEDFLMNFYLFRGANKSVFLDQCYYHYMVRKGSAATSTVNESKLRDPLKVLKIMHRELINEPQLVRIVEQRLVRQLINLSTLPLGKQAELIEPHRTEARRELRAMLPQILKGSFNPSTKIKALWTSMWPASYHFVHYLYVKMLRLDKKYEVG